MELVRHLKALSEDSSQEERVIAWGEALQDIHEMVEEMRTAPLPEGEQFHTALRAFRASLDDMVWCLVRRTNAPTRRD